MAVKFPAPATEHWVVVGLMGSGKSTVGAMIAARTGRPLLDNDEWLTQLTGTSARQIAATEGLHELHLLERGVLASALQTTIPAVIIAAASVVDTAEGRAELARAAAVVWLDAPVEVLAARVAAADHRPLDADVSTQLAQQHADRSALLAEVADIRVDATPPARAVADAVEAALHAVAAR